MMNKLPEISEYLKSNDNYVIIPHKNPDGDCVGSATALLMALRKLGKNVRIVLPSPINERLSFLWDDSFSEGVQKNWIAVCTDVASTEMMGTLYEKIFKTASAAICIDHHGTNHGYADMNYVDPAASATGEIIYDLIKLMGVDVDVDIAERLLVSIADDTGCFQYPNTTFRTHEIAAELYHEDIDSRSIMQHLYNFHKKSEIDILKVLLDNMEYHCDGKVCITHITHEVVAELGGDFSQTDAWIGLLRSVEGVEVGMLFKIHSESEVKVSLRSNEYVDVSEVAKAFGGGGHSRAAGVTFFESSASAKAKLVEKLEKLV